MRASDRNEGERESVCVREIWLVVLCVLVKSDMSNFVDVFTTFPHLCSLPPLTFCTFSATNIDHDKAPALGW